MKLDEQKQPAAIWPCKHMLRAARAFALSIECPWPKSVWPMTEKQYVKAVPDPQTRTAISGFLMRRGWEVAVMQIKEAQNITGERPEAI